MIEIASCRECRLRLGDFDWEFAASNRDAISSYWRLRSAENSHLFNGRLLLMSRWDLADGIFEGRYFRTDFASFLYWQRQLEDGHGGAGPAISNCSGAALIRGADGGLLLGVAAAHTANAGIAYPLSGFVDEQDVHADGSVDPDGNVAREMAEEAGFDATALARQPGYLMSIGASSIHFGIEYRANASATELRRQALQRIARQSQPELADIIVVGSPAELAGVVTSDHTRAYADFLFAHR